jgi:L-cystine transport system permease protein
MNFRPEIFFKALSAGLQMAPLTLLIALSSTAIGLALGMLMALARFYRIKVLDQIIRVFVPIIRGIPTLIILTLFYVYFHIRLRAPISDSMLIVFGLVRASCGGACEMFRGALEAIDKSQFDAAASVCLTRSATFFRIVLPQVLPVCIPMLSNTFIGMLKAVAVAMLFGINDILNAALEASMPHLAYLEGYVAGGIIYWALCFGIEQGCKYMERHFKGKMRTQVRTRSLFRKSRLKEGI